MSTASDLLALYIEAEKKILAGQEATINDGTGSQTLRHADLETVRKERARLERRVAEEARAAAGGRNPRYQVADFS